jgi:hypothetical protein
MALLMFLAARFLLSIYLVTLMGRAESFAMLLVHYRGFVIIVFVFSEWYMRNQKERDFNSLVYLQPQHWIASEHQQSIGEHMLGYLSGIGQ